MTTIYRWQLRWLSSWWTTCRHPSWSRTTPFGCWTNCICGVGCELLSANESEFHRENNIDFYCEFSLALLDCVIAVKLAFCPSYFPIATPLSDNFMSIEKENAGLMFILRNLLVTVNWNEPTSDFVLFIAIRRCHGNGNSKHKVDSTFVLTYLKTRIWLELIFFTYFHNNIWKICNSYFMLCMNKGLYLRLSDYKISRLLLKKIIGS